MIKSLLTAAAFVALGVPAASAHGTYQTQITARKAVPVVAVTTQNLRGVRNRRNVRRASLVSVTVPAVQIQTPVLSIVAAPVRTVKTVKRAVPVRSRRVIRR